MVDAELPVVVDGDVIGGNNVVGANVVGANVVGANVVRPNVVGANVNTIKTKHLQRHLFIIFVFSVFLKAY